MTGSAPDFSAPKLGILTSRFAVPGLLILLTVAVYLPSLGGQFLWDDNVMVSGNPAMSRPGGLHKIWTGTGGPDYYPLTLTLLWAEWHGWELNPLGYHLVTVALHAAGVLLLWLLLKRLGIPGAAWGAAIFAVHPVNVETVAWISETKNTLSLVFYLAALLAFLRFDERPRAKPYALALALAFFLLALLSKTTVVMLPCVLLLLAWWLRGRVARQDLLRSIPFFALSAALGVTTLLVQKKLVADTSAPMMISFWERCLTAGQVFWFYAGKAIFPHPLLTVYPPFTPLGVLPDLALVAALLALWVFRRNDGGRALLFATAYFLLSLAPVLGFIDSSYSVRYSPVADHYQYLALAGIAALAGAGIAWLPSRTFPSALVCGLGLVAALSVVTTLQEAPYRSQSELFARLLQDAPYSPRAYTLMGTALLEEGRYLESVDYLESAIAVDPQDFLAHYNLCSGFVRLGRWEEAASQCREALEVNPQSRDAMVDLAIVLDQQGRPEESIATYERALQVAPLSAVVHYDFGVELQKRKRSEEAVDHFREALRINPDLTQAQQHIDEILKPRGSGQ